jgi:DNA helicase II / ATP-dependent DNA helicase PcrA
MPLTPSTLLDGLNEAQQTAVMTTEGPLLVVAGPGTGKTLTIVRRLAWLVRKGVPPEQILAVTFTNRAAREMKERTEALLGNAAAPIFIGTFHLLGLRIIREQGRDFTLLNRDEQTAVLKTLIKGTSKALQQELERISGFKNFLEGHARPPDVYDAYQSALAQRNALDFDDLIRLPLEMMQDGNLRQGYRGRFTHIIVDEYQDINPAQYRLLRLLCPENGNLCVVGDSDQGIYSFRGADLRNFLNFERDFPGARRIDLSLNYRSTATIVGAAERVIRKNRKRIERQLTPTGETGSPIILYSVPDDRAEGAAIIDEIELRMGGMSHEAARESSKQEEAGRSYRFSDFAVIYRTNAQARALEQAFAASGIPFQVIGKPSGIQRREAEETLAFLRALAGTAAGAEKAPQRTGAIEARLLTEADFFDPRAEAVALLTMHMAKGLEFPVVFIAGCEDGLVPCTIMKDGIDLEEERRLFYVGMTRAKERLFLLHARKRFLYGQNLGQKTSPFVKEIPAELIESRTVADRAKKENPEESQMGLF